ncbi:MAG: GAF domain-containing protein [Nitrospirota bacterium]
MEEVNKKLQSMQLKLSAIQEVSNLLITQLKLDEILDQMMEIILKVTLTDAGTLMLLDEVENCLVFKITKGEKAEAIKGYKLKLDEGIAGFVAQTGEPTIIPDVSKEPRFKPEVAKEIDFKTYNILCVPMKIKERIVGVIEVINRLEKEPFSIDDLDLLTALANQAAIVIENNKLLQDSQEAVRRLKTLLEVTDVLGATKDLRSLLDLSMRLATRTMSAEASSLMLLDEKTNELVFEVVEGVKGKQVLRQIRLKSGEGIAGWVAKEGTPLLVPDVTKDPRFTSKIDQQTSFETKCILCVPLKIKKTTIGIIEVINKVDGGSVFSEKDMEFFSLFAHQVAIAIENARLYTGKRLPMVEIEEKPTPTPGKRLRLGEILMEYNLVTQSQVDEALRIQQERGKPQTKEKIGQILIRMGATTEDAVNCALSAQLDVPYVWLTPQMVQEEAIKFLPRELLEHYALIPIMKIGNELTLVMSDPTDENVIQDIKSITGAEIKLSLGSKQNILDIISQVLGEKPKIKEPESGRTGILPVNLPVNNIEEIKSGDEFEHLQEAVKDIDRRLQAIEQITQKAHCP